MAHQHQAGPFRIRGNVGIVGALMHPQQRESGIKHAMFEFATDATENRRKTARMRV